MGPAGMCWSYESRSSAARVELAMPELASWVEVCRVVAVWRLIWCLVPTAYRLYCLHLDDLT
jgi:hypothetical protein